jgi:hypothetical protein
MRYGPTGEAYIHRHKEGKLISNDFAGFMPEHKKWGEARDNGVTRRSCSSMSAQMEARNISG